MTKDIDSARHAADLRHRAEQRLRDGVAAGDGAAALHELQLYKIELEMQSEELQRERMENEAALQRHSRLHELQIHQIELEMQNEELLQARAETEAALQRYSELYQYAPVGYLTLGCDGRIRQVNFAAEHWLDAEGGKLVNRRIEDFVANKDREAFNDFIAGVFAGDARQTCELALVNSIPRYVHVDTSTDMAEQTCNMTMTNITGRKIAEDKLAAAYRELQQLTARQEMLMSNERERIARELHDEMGATLSVLSMNINRVTSLLPDTAPELKAEIGAMAKLVKTGMQTMYQAVTQLRVSLPENMGLADAIRYKVRKFRQQSGIECGLVLPGEDITANGNTSFMLYRILKESLNNVLKHAGASKVEVSLEVQHEALLLRVKDNGIGFDSGGLMEQAFGLTGIRERALMMGGKAEISSAPGEGTEVMVRVPLPLPEAFDKAHSRIA